LGLAGRARVFAGSAVGHVERAEVERRSDLPLDEDADEGVYPRVHVVRGSCVHSGVDLLRIDASEEPPLSISERARLRELEREVRELKMKAEFLGKAAAFFAQESR
jgi:hypothetical protein